MKKVFIIITTLLIIISLLSFYIVRNHFIEKGADYYRRFLNYTPTENKEMTFLDKNGEIFFSQTVIFGGELLHDELDNISKLFLDKRCKLDHKKDNFLTVLFNIDFEKLNSFHVGCLENIPENSFEIYGLYNYVQNNANPKLIDKTILDKINYNEKIFGVQGLANYLYGKRYGDLNPNEKIYLFYKLEEKDNLTIDLEEYKSKLYNISDKSQINLIKNRRSFDKYPHISEAILKELKEYGLDKINHKAIIQTSFDPQTYQKVKDIVSAYFEKKDPKIQSAGVIIDIEEGEIITLYGSKNENSKLNRAINLRRQVGSVFKPVVYLAAFENGVKPTDIIEDKPTTYGKGKNAYSPKNFEDFYMGKTKVENALIYSLNNGTLQVALKTGLNNVATMAEKLGLSAKPLLGFCLGSGEYTVLEVANYFGVIANNGIKKRIGFVKKIINTEDNTTIDLTSEEVRVVSEDTAKLIQSILAKVVKIGTARGAGLLKGTYGKTGTTNDYRDAWFASAYDKYVIVVWVGRDDYKSMDEKGTGGGIAAPLVAKIQRGLNLENNN